MKPSYGSNSRYTLVGVDRSFHFLSFNLVIKKKRENTSSGNTPDNFRRFLNLTDPHSIEVLLKMFEGPKLRIIASTSIQDHDRNLDHTSGVFPMV